MPRKYFGRFIPKKSWFDINNDGDVDYRDFLVAAQNTLEALTPSKNVFDVNGDGVVDVNDALDAARITGATITGAGVTLGAGAVAGSILVTGKATAIATLITSSIGATVGTGLGAVFGTTTGTLWAAVQLSNGAWILATETVVTMSPAFVMTMSSAGALIAGTAKGAIDSIAGLTIIHTAALKSLVASSELIVIAGIPVAREVALAAGLIAVVIVGGYAYYVLTRNRIDADEVREAVDSFPSPA